VPLAALQFDLHDFPEGVEVTSASAVGRAAGFEIAYLDDGSARFVMYHPAGNLLPAGSGPILAAGVTVSDLALDELTLSFSGIVAGDDAGEPVSVSGQNGVFDLIRMRGDVNGDGVIDVTDLVRLLDIILGAGAPATPEESLRADCNADGAIDALDVICVLDAILGSPQSVDEPLVAWEVETGVAVRALEFVFPAGSRGGVEAADELATRTGTRAGRRVSVVYDAKGGGLEAGERTEFLLGGTPEAVHAFGEAGERIPVRLSDRTLRIGSDSGLRILTARPNPFRANTVVTFSLAEPGEVGVTVHDVRGAMVADLGTRDRAAGEHTVTWDGTADGGTRVGAGLYFVRIRTAEEIAARKLMRIAD
jgi:hypothetical protein